MANSIKYSESSESLALNKGNWWIGTGDSNKGPTVESGYWNAINPPSGGYTVYLNKETNGPSIHSIPSDENLISFTNKISGNNYTTVAECLVYYQTQDDKLCVNREYENIVTDGLILNLDAGYVPSYPTSGTTWYDLSGNEYNGTLYNGPIYSGDSISFDGSNDYAQFNNVTSKITTKATISTFATISSLTTYQRILGGGGRTTIARFYNPKIINWNLYINNKGYLNLFSNTTILENVIYCITGTVDLTNNIYKLYINGILENSSNIPVGSDFLFYQGEFRINSSSIQPYGGKIFTVQVYDRALSDSEVLQNYNALKGRFGL